MKIKKLRKQLKKFQQEHGNVPVVMAGYGRDVKVVTWYDESGERRYANAWSAPRFPRHRLPERPYPKGLVFLNEQGDWDRRVGYDGVQWVVRAHGV